MTASAGTYVNTSGAVTSTNGGTGNTASATLTAAVLPPDLHWKRFSPTTIQAGGTSTLSLNIRNPNTGTALTGISLTDTFPTGMTLVGTPETPQCGGTISSSTAGSITLSNGTLDAATQCTLYATVTAATPGSYTNNSGIVTSTNGGTGNASSATLTVGAYPAAKYQQELHPVLNPGGHDKHTVFYHL